MHLEVTVKRGERDVFEHGGARFALHHVAKCCDLVALVVKTFLDFVAAFIDSVKQHGRSPLPSGAAHPRTSSSEHPLPALRCAPTRNRIA